MASRSVSPAQQPEEARTPGTPEESPAVEKQTPAEELLPFHDVGLPATKIWVHPNCPEPDVLKADIVAWGGVVTEKMRGAHYALFRNLFEDRDDVEQARRDYAEPVLSSWIKEVVRSFEKWRDDPALSSVPFVRKFFENDIKAVDDKPRKGRVNITHQEKQRIIYEVSRFKNPNELTPQGGKNYKVWDELERWSLKNCTEPRPAARYQEHYRKYEKEYIEAGKKLRWRRIRKARNEPVSGSSSLEDSDSEGVQTEDSQMSDREEGLRARRKKRVERELTADSQASTEKDDRPAPRKRRTVEKQVVVDSGEDEDDLPDLSIRASMVGSMRKKGGSSPSKARHRQTM